MHTVIVAAIAQCDVSCLKPLQGGFLGTQSMKIAIKNESLDYLTVKPRDPTVNILSQYQRVTDGETDGRTDRNTAYS